MIEIYDALEAGLIMIILAFSAGCAVVVVAGVGIGFQSLCSWLDRREEKRVNYSRDNINEPVD